VRSLIGGGGGGGAVADAALLIGLPDAGKTALFEQLHFGRLRQTLTSMRENQCSIVDGGKSVPLIDVPGHARLRENIREKYAKQAKRVVFVIDAKEFKETSRETAECVHLSRSILPLVLLVRFRGRAHLISDTNGCRRRRLCLPCAACCSLLLNVLDDSDFRKRNLLVACNKSDYDMMCSSEKFIKHRLEKEIDLLLSTRGKDVMATDGEAKSSVVDSLLPEGEKFTFEGIAAGSGGWDVAFGSCSAKKGEIDVVRSFLMA
jgi:signal recognition particle receptor subunit beta